MVYPPAGGHPIQVLTPSLAQSNIPNPFWLRLVLYPLYGRQPFAVLTKNFLATLPVEQYTSLFIRSTDSIDTTIRHSNKAEQKSIKNYVTLVS